MLFLGHVAAAALLKWCRYLPQCSSFCMQFLWRCSRIGSRKPTQTPVREIPTASSTKQEIIDYLALHGIEVAMDTTKTLLLQELDDFVESRGGLAALRCYAAEKICSDLGVTLVRLPPFHCFFNPVEMCWSYLKHRLNKIGRPTDRLEIVRSRTLEILGSLPRQLCEGWCRETLREEEAARSKEVLDGGSHGGGGGVISSSSDISSDSASEELLTDFSTEL